MTTELVTCYRHHDRRAGVTCQRCSRPICPSCMVQASVGFHCPECTAKARGQVVTARELLNRTPVVTYALIAINALFFLAALVTASDLGSGAGVVGASGGRSVGLGSAARAFTDRQRHRQRGRQRRVVAHHHRRVPACRPLAHRHEHARALADRRAARTSHRPDSLRVPLLDEPDRRFTRRAADRSDRAHGWRVGRRVRLDGRGRDLPTIARASTCGVRGWAR